MVLTYFVNQGANLPFPVYDLFDFLARVLPGSVVTFGIHLIESIADFTQPGQISRNAKLAEHFIALAQFALMGGLWAMVLTFLGRWLTERYLILSGIGSGIILGIIFILISRILGSSTSGPIPAFPWLLFIFATWGGSISGLISSLQDIKDEEGASRRSFIYLAGTAVLAVITGVPGILFNLTRGGSMAESEAGSALFHPEVTSGPAASPSALVLDNRIEPAPGMRSEITSNADFYRVDINSVPPRIDAQQWRLKVGGKVQHPREFTLQDLKSFPAISQYITLRCISNPVGGSLISTALYTGVPLKSVMDAVGLLPEARQVHIQSQDGFYESVVMSDLQDERTLLVYEMNQQPLPAAHGFPLRLYIPNRYGMKQPKWIISLEAIDHEGSGFWVDRDWSREALVYTTSVVDNVAVNQPAAGKTLPAGGIAWAGDQGIGRVEVRVDNGPWQQAELRKPPLSPLTWIQWRAMISTGQGKHTIQVRAYDLKGKPQTIRKKDTGRLDAETGLDELNFTVT